MIIKVVCISVGNYDGDINLMYPLSLTIGKVCEATVYVSYYEILNDRGFYNLYPKEYFITLAEHREQQINSILNE